MGLARPYNKKILLQNPRFNYIEKTGIFFFAQIGLVLYNKALEKELNEKIPKHDCALSKSLVGIAARVALRVEHVACRREFPRRAALSRFLLRSIGNI